MPDRLSFTHEQVEQINARFGFDTKRILPTRRGSVILVKSDSEQSILKIADLTLDETEKHIQPPRSKGIQNEVAVLQKLQGNVAPKLRCFEHDEEAKLMFSISEYVDARPLGECFDDIEDKSSAMISFLQAISELHVQKIIHGDIQPANILWMEDGQIKIIDYELSKSTTDNQISEPGLYHFLSPEAVRQVIDTTHCVVDIVEETFAVAATILSLLSNADTPAVFPESAKTHADRLQQLLKPTYQNSFFPELDAVGKKIISTLQLQQNERPKTIDGLMNEIL